MELRCETCRHWNRWEGYGGDNKGDCRVGPPTFHPFDAIAGTQGHWPWTFGTQGCGEHEERTELPVVDAS